MTVIWVSTLPLGGRVAVVLDKIKAFFKRPKLAEKKAAETKVAEAPEKKGDESSSK